MEAISLSITTGIVSGIIASILIYIFIVFWTRHLIPWYEERSYKGISLKGTWVLEEESDNKQDDPWTQVEIIELDQHACQLSGVVNISPKPNETFPSVKLILNGEVIDRFVLLQMRSNDTSKMSYGAALLQVVGNGSSMEGQAAYYDVVESKIISANVIYKRS